MSSLTLRTVSGSELPIPGFDPWFAEPDDPAVSVMTDFRERASVTVPQTLRIDVALEHMKHAGVRSAFAVDEQRRVVGLITAYDITGDAPVRHMQDHRIRRHEVMVSDLMQDVAHWRVVEMRDIERATVESVARLFDETRLTHIPVVETDDRGARRLRGMLSGARVRRLLSR